MKFDAVFVVGVGGTGSHLIGPLTQLMSYHPEGCTNIVVIDGDSYEDNNANRQVFDAKHMGANKAVATVERLGHPDMRAVAAYVDQESFGKLLASHVTKRSKILVITSVDNHATRKAIIDCLDTQKYQNFFLLSPGNTFSTGQVITYVKHKGRVVGNHPYEKYPEMQNPDDFIPGTVEGCAAMLSSTPQLILANMAAAWGCLANVNSLLEDKGWFDELHFDALKSKIVPRPDKIKSLLVEFQKAESIVKASTNPHL